MISSSSLIIMVEKIHCSRKFASLTFRFDWNILYDPYQDHMALSSKKSAVEILISFFLNSNLILGSIAIFNFVSFAFSSIELNDVLVN